MMFDEKEEETLMAGEDVTLLSELIDRMEDQKTVKSVEKSPARVSSTSSPASEAKKEDLVNLSDPPEEIVAKKLDNLVHSVDRLSDIIQSSLLAINNSLQALLNQQVEQPRSKGR